MTEASRAPVARVPRGLALGWVFTLSLLVALAIAGGLALQMAVGRDPALGPKRIAATAEPMSTPATPAAAPAPAPVQTTTS